MKLVSYVIGNIIGVLSLIVILLCAAIFYITAQSVFLQYKRILRKCLRHIKIRDKWVRKRISTDWKKLVIVFQRVLDSLYLSSKVICLHSIRFILAYTLPILILLSIIYGKNLIEEVNDSRHSFLELQWLNAKQKVEIKELKDSLDTIRAEFGRYKHTQK